MEISLNFIHPAELKTLKDISKISHQYREIRKFISQYSTYANDNSRFELEVLDDALPPGFYLQAFANGLDTVLSKYHDVVVDLEKKFLKKPTTSLMFIFHEVNKFRPLFEFLLRLINGIQTQKKFGCQILQVLQDNSMHGSDQIMEAVLEIQRSVYVVFIQQLCQWLIYGKFVDTYNEFFIVHGEEGEEKRPLYLTQASINTFNSSDPSVNTDLWHYEINFDMLPHYFPKSWAEKVLFIGQTVLMLNCDPRDLTQDVANKEKMLIWSDREQHFFHQFHQLQKGKISVLIFERIIDEIKTYVTKHLSEIAIKDADLVKQLKLIKDFFLLGRGELFYEFIKGLQSIYGKMINENSVRDINRIFNISAASVNISDDVEIFQFELATKSLESLNGYESQDLFQSLLLRYKIKWPLHLLFPPKVLEKYNELFRFLIHIRKIQFDLQMLWCHHREQKVGRNSEMLQFRNKLMFLIDNLQYYLQVDVLESQFSIMLDKIKETNDFEQIIRAHGCFQANILGLCFLLETVSVLS